MTAVASASVGMLHAGSILGRYELLLPVAQGGMATVWAARMKGTRNFSKIVAIKTMLPALSNDPRFEKMFLSEAEIASRIKHPNVCEILDLGEEEGTLYLTMEWIDGESLVTLQNDAERQGRPLPFAVVTRLGIEAAKGLHAAHELKDEAGNPIGVVHRDVSPHNILVTYEGLVKIVDFGVAKAVARSDHQATQAGHIKGKVQFMAPEQAFCDDVDRRVDVFALGIVLYQLVTGVHPFRADNELATMARITSPEPVPSPLTLAEDCPPELAAVVMKALAKERDERYASMSELAHELEQVATKLTMPAPERDPESFIRELLKGRAEARAATIKQAVRAADERPSTLSLSGVTPLTKEQLATFARLSEEDSSGDLLRTSASVERLEQAMPVKPGRRLALAVALFSLGALIGAAALIGVTRSVAPPVAAAFVSGLPAPTAAPTTGAGDAPIAATVAAVEVVSAAPVASAAPATSAIAGAPASAAPSGKVEGVPALKGTLPLGKGPPKKFRNPGF